MLGASVKFKTRSSRQVSSQAGELSLVATVAHLVLVCMIPLVTLCYIFIACSYGIDLLHLVGDRGVRRRGCRARQRGR